MATDTITVVYNWLRTSYLLHLDVDIGSVTTFGSNHALCRHIMRHMRLRLGGGGRRQVGVGALYIHTNTQIR